MGLASSVAKLLASLDLDTKPFEAGARRVSGSLGQMESRATRVGRTLGTGINTAAKNITRIGVAAAGFLGTQVFAGVRSLEELERVTNATAGVIESTGGKAGVSAAQVREYAQSLEQVTTADDKAIQSAENLLLTFTNIGGGVFPQATKSVVDLGIAMAQGDVANADYKASAIQIGKALNDPIKGITALSRVGVSFTDQQKEQIAAMVEAGDVAGAQAVILKELETEFGNAGKAAGQGFGADMRRFQDAVEDGQQALATGFLPTIRRVSTFLTTKLTDPAVQNDIRKLGDSLASAFDQILDIGGRLPWAQIGDAFKLMGTGSKALLDAFTSLPPWVQTAVLTGWGLNKLTGGALDKIGMELLLPKGIGSLFGRGSSPATPMYTKEIGLGGGSGGGVAPVAAAKGGLGLVSKVFLVGEAIGLASLIIDVKNGIEEGWKNQTTQIGADLDRVIAAQDTAGMQQALSGIDQGLAQLATLNKGDQQNPMTAATVAALEQQRREIIAALYRTSSIEARDEAYNAGLIVDAVKVKELKQAEKAGKLFGDALKPIGKAIARADRRDERQQDRQDAKTDKRFIRQRDAIEAVRIRAQSDAAKTKTTISQTKIALISAEQNSRSAIVSSDRITRTNIVSAEQRAAAMIVRAIWAARTIVNVSTTNTSVVKSGGTTHKSTTDPMNKYNNFG